MLLLVFEALLALFILVGIVWWTMFSGRKNGEIESKVKTDAQNLLEDKTTEENSAPKPSKNT
jgi:hypothetical protein